MYQQTGELPRNDTKRYALGTPGDSREFPGFRDSMSCHENDNWRRERDSNPRWAFDPYTLSRGAPSTTRPSLRRAQMIRTGREAGKANDRAAQPIAVTAVSLPFSAGSSFSLRIRS